MKTKNLTLSEALATGLPCRIQKKDPKDVLCFDWKELNDLKLMDFSFHEATEPIWEVKREPLEFTLWYSPSIEDVYSCNPMPKDSYMIKVREVLD